MSHRLGRVVSDFGISRSSSVKTTDHSQLHHRSATSNDDDEGGNVGKAAKQKLSLLVSSVVGARTRSQSSGETGSMRREKNGSSRKQQTNGGGGTAGGRRRRRRGLEIVLAVRKYVAMLEQLFTSSSSSYSASSSSRDVDGRWRRDGRQPHTFTSVRHSAGQSSSKRHRPGRLSSAPASLRGSPATSGHLHFSEGEAVPVTKASTSSEVSTMEELQSAIQAAIAHCKNSVAAAAAGDKQQHPAA